MKVSVPTTIEREKELVLIPRKEYETLLRSARKQKTALDRRLEKAIASVERGEISKAFTSAAKFMDHLKQK